LKLNEKTLVALTIQRKIETFDAKAHSMDLIQALNEDLQVVSHQTQNLHKYITGSEHVSLGSPSTVVSIGDLERQYVDNPSFTNFRKKIGNAFSNYFNENIKFNAVDQVLEINSVFS
jgi:hypothetical protein